MSTQYRLVQSGKTASGGCSAGSRFVRACSATGTEGKNYRGRPRLAYINQIMKDVGCTTCVEMKSKAERRAEWRAAANQSSDW
jgi:penicillin V acylase-like amidase (Ntn superfamily)